MAEKLSKRFLQSELSSQINRVHGYLQSGDVKTVEDWNATLEHDPISPREKKGLSGTVQARLKEILKHAPSSKSATGLTWEQKYEALADFTTMVATGDSNGLVAHGPGGLGKTHIVLEALRAFKKKHTKFAYQYKKGYASPGALYNFLYHHREETIVLDDMDNVFKDPIVLNILKAVLDSYEERVVGWESNSALITAPPSFIFRGRIIFMTNVDYRSLSTHIAALLTRVLVVNMSFTQSEILEKMRAIARDVEYKGIIRKDRLAIVGFIRNNLADIPQLNLRTYFQIADFYKHKKSTWRKNARRLFQM